VVDQLLLDVVCFAITLGAGRVRKKRGPRKEKCGRGKREGRMMGRKG